MIKNKKIRDKTLTTLKIKKSFTAQSIEFTVQFAIIKITTLKRDVFCFAALCKTNSFV